MSHFWRMRSAALGCASQKKVVMNLNDKESLRFAGELYESIVRASRGEKPLSMVEAVDDECRKFAFKGTRSGTEFGNGGIVVPLATLARAQHVNTAAGGGFTVGTEPPRIDAVMRSASVTGRAGAQTFTGLQGDWPIALENTVMTLGWKSEIEEVTESEGTFGQLVLRPRRLSGVTTITQQLDGQTAGATALFLMQSITAGIGEAIDEGALVGTGLAGSVKGLYSTPNVGTVTFGGAATGTKASDFLKTIENNDGKTESLTWVASPTTKAKWQNIDRFSGGGLPLWSDSETILGRPAYATTSMGTNDICAGDFSKQITAFWGAGGVPVQLLVDRITEAKSGKIRVVINIFADVGFLRPTLFVKNADSANQ